MKQILFLLLLITATVQGQTTLANKLKITGNVTDNVATKVNVQDATGLINTIAKSDLIEVIEVASAINLPVTGVAGKIYVTIDSGRLYRWNTPVYTEISVGGVTSVSGINGVTVSNPSTTPIIGLGNITPTTVATGSVNFTPQIVPPSYLEGKAFYDSTAKTLVVYDDISGTASNVTQELNLRARNSTGVTIPNGSVVYISGATGQNPIIALAKANLLATSVTIGVATHDILNNTIGKITTFGIVNDLNTSSFTDGQVLYLSPTTAGLLTSTAPTSPNYTAYVCVVLHAHNTQGRIFVRPEQPIALNVALTDNNNTSPSVTAVKSYVDTGLALKANLASPTLTGVPLAPTATAGTNTTQIATTAFVLANSMNIPQLEFNNSNKTVWNNGNGNISTNTAFGENTLLNNTTGSHNTVHGANALLNNTTGFNNIAVGANALLYNTTGFNNTVNGLNALYNNVTGSNNTVHGANALLNNTTGNNNTAFGFNAGALNPADNNSIIIGSGAIGIGSNTTVIGNSSITRTLLRGSVETSGSFINSTAPATNALLANGTTLANPISGTGTTNFLPKFTGDNLLGNSSIFDNGTNVGIGTITPTTKLTIQQNNNNSAISVRNGVTSAHNALYFGNDSTTNSSFLGSYKGDDSNFSTLVLQKFGGLTNITGTLAVEGSATFSSSVTAKQLLVTNPFGSSQDAAFIQQGEFNKIALRIKQNNVSADTNIIQVENSSTTLFGILPTGAATFSSSVTATNYSISSLNTAPASATATGTTGEIRITAGFIYVCTATNTWVRTALATW